MDDGGLTAGTFHFNGFMGGVLQHAGVEASANGGEGGRKTVRKRKEEWLVRHLKVGGGGDGVNRKKKQAGRSCSQQTHHRPGPFRVCFQAENNSRKTKQIELGLNIYFLKPN